MISEEDIDNAERTLEFIAPSVWERVMGTQGRREFATLVVDAGHDAEAEWMIAQISAGMVQPGRLCNYQTGSDMRRATVAEASESIRAAADDGGCGVIIIDGIACYVD